MNPRVSVIITTYNRPNLLKRAIQSVLSQDFKNFEVIVVDDGSSGETEKVVESFKDSRLIYIRNEKNLGGTKSLNIGLKTSKGEYICPLDDDDEWIDRQKLFKQLDFLETHPDCVAVGTNAEARLLDEKGDLVKVVITNVPIQNEELQKRGLLTSPVAHVSSMYRRQTALAVGGYDESLERGKDWDLFLKMSRLGKLSNLPDVSVRFDEKRNVALKYKDSKIKLRIIWRHRHHRHFLRSLFSETARCLIFKLFLIFPSLYKLYKKL